MRTSSRFLKSSRSICRLASRRAEYCPPIHDLEVLPRAYGEVIPRFDLGSMEFTGLTGYAVEFLYDAEFWPPQ